MKIVDRKTFIAMPAGTVYQKYQPCIFGPVNIKMDSCGDFDWFYLCGISEPNFGESNTGEYVDCCNRLERGEHIPIVVDGVTCRDGLFDDDQLFAVWDADDTRTFISAFTKTLP